MAMNTLYVRDDQVRQVAALLRQAPQVVEEELRTWVTGATAHLQAETVERTPTTHGTLRSSILGDVQVLPGLGITGTVGTSLGYAVPVEMGTRPHAVGKDGIEALADWARHKLGVSGSEAEAVAWRVAWKIRRHGTQGAFMFQRAFEENQAQILSGLDVAIQRIGARIAGGQT